MQSVISTRTICPNCGSSAAERHQLMTEQLTRTQCPHCDYLMVSCNRTNRVLESYAPGIDAIKFQHTVQGKS